MSSRHRSEILVGGFVAAAFGLFVLLLVLMGTLGRLVTPTVDLQVVFSDIRGLRCGDPVSFIGHKVGAVRSIEIARRRWAEEAPDLFPGETGETSRAVITLTVDGGVLPHLRSDSTVEIDKNLTGNLTVLIREGKGGPLPAGKPVLRGSPGADLAVIADRVDGMLKKVDPAIDDLAAFARRLAGSRSLDGAIQDMADTLRQVREGIGPIREALAGTLGDARAILDENRGDIRTIAGNLAAGSETARRVIEKVEPAAGGLKDALAAAERAAGSAAKAIEANRPGIDSTIEEIRSAVANASNITADIRRRPWRLLYKPSTDEVEAMDLYDAAWAYNLGAADLERSLRQLTARLDAERDGTGSPDALRAARRDVEESLRRHREAEDAFWERLKRR